MAGRILRTNSGDAPTNPVLVGRRLPSYTVGLSVRPSTDPASVEARLSANVRSSVRPSTDPASVEARLAVKAPFRRFNPELGNRASRTQGRWRAEGE